MLHDMQRQNANTYTKKQKGISIESLGINLANLQFGPYKCFPQLLDMSFVDFGCKYTHFF